MSCFIRYMMKVPWWRVTAVGLLLLMQQYTALGVGSINTCEGGAQQRQSYIYPSQEYPDDSPIYIYGNVELRGGVNVTSLSQLYLSLTPPMSGSIAVHRDAIFYLWNDLTLGKMAFVYGAGDIRAHRLYIISQVASGATEWGVNFVGDVTVDVTGGVFTLFFNGDPGYTTVYDGNHYKLILTPGCDLQANNVTFKDLTVMNAENLHYNSGSSNECLMQNVTLNSSLAYDPLHSGTIFNQGRYTSLAFRGMQNILNGGGAFSFRNTGGTYVRIVRNSQLYVAPQTTLMLGTDFYGDSSTYIFDDATSVLYLDNCTVFVGNQGEAGQPAVSAILKKGTVYINGTVTLKTVYGSYLQLGDGIDPANNCTVVMLPGAKLSLENYNDSIWAHTTYGAVLVNKNV